jgi:release factor glutamine methyltransferase
MPVPSSPAVQADIITRLRAAGCVFAEDEAALLVSSAPTPADLSALVERRVAGEPLEHILGWAQFCGRRIAVDAGVFVPRRRSEFLALEAARLAGSFDRPVVLDLCCGSGALGAALVALVDGVELHAADIDPIAAQCAQRNVPAARVYAGDLYQPLPASLRGRVDVLVANAPYVPSEAVALMPPEARDHEPRVALDGGADGLDVLRRVVAGAPAWLSAPGQLVVEASERQAGTLVEAVIRAGLAARTVELDELNTTIVIGTRRWPHRGAESVTGT